MYAAKKQMTKTYLLNFVKPLLDRLKQLRSRYRNNTSANTIVVYHQINSNTDCPDGICAAWVVAQKYLDSGFCLIGDTYLNNEDYEKDTYYLPFNPTGKDVILVDFSYPRSVLQFIADRAKSLTVLDHHKSRLDDISALRDRILGGYNPDECGATFAWRFLFPDKEIPWFLPHVKNRDIGANGYYEGDIPNSEAINTAISARRSGLRGVNAFGVFDRLINETPQALLEEGLPAIKERDRLVEEALGQYNGAVINVAGYVVPYYQLANPATHKHYSIVGSVAARKHGDAPFIAIVADDPLKISLRASKNSSVDLSEIAKSLGGGGHPRAAGYSIRK